MITIVHIIAEAAVSRRPNMTSKDRAEALRLRAEGLDPGQIAERLGRHRTTIVRALAKKTPRNVTTGGKRIQVLLSEEEFAAFKAKASAHGMTLSDAGRRLVRHSEGILDWPRERIEAVDRLRRELNAIGVNVNQMTQLAQSGRLSWNARDAAAMKKLDAKLDTLVSEMVRVVSAARVRAFVDAVWSSEEDRDAGPSKQARVSA